MKKPIYLISFLVLAVGVSWAVPPTKSNYQSFQRVRKEHQEKAKEARESGQTVQQSTQRQSTVGLNIGKEKRQTSIIRRHLQRKGY
tara:strand:+ start:16740 stop:16997 length:258 start_codon:yes stop_codon:yes gene_type:complete